MKIKQIILFSCIAITLFGCGKNDYPASTVTNFVTSCINNGGDPDMCSCAIDNIQHHLTHDEYIKLENRVAVGDTEATVKFTDMVTPCRK